MTQRERATFDAAELAVVLSYWDLGVIESVTPFLRGSLRSPKVGVVSERGKFLLKRRAPRRAHPDRVRFSHRVQQHLAAGGFPVARLQPTRDRGHTFVQLRESIYELFEFIAGGPFRHTVEEAMDAGYVLARFHQAMHGFAAPPSLPAPRGDYHEGVGVRSGLLSIGSTLSSHDSFTGDEAELAALVQFLVTAYEAAQETVETTGFSALPPTIVHCDWHPGNLLFRKERVVAALDYDSVRLSRQVIDVANGALQFSMVASGDPAGWPEHTDEARYHAFLKGYESLFPLSPQEWSWIPHLMTQALIAECVPPIQETGSLGPWAGFRVLQMVRRKLRWLAANETRLERSARGVVAT
ncbi:MAG: phosphotransferase [Planctomycetes bacterium]|nr:phosphotransferase [Planctomycetota bacterium]